MFIKLIRRNLCLALIFGMIVGFGIGFVDNSTSSASSRKSLDTKEVVADQNYLHVFEQVASQVKPAVVSITSVKVLKNGQQRQWGLPNLENDPFGNFRQFFGDDFFDRFFRPRYPDGDYKVQGLGSGVIVDSENGYIVTNNHVVENADELKVVLGDKREFDGKVIGTDPQTDIAVIKIEGTQLPSAEFGDSNLIRVGQWAVAIGNPFGLTQTVSVGVVSAVGRVNVGIAQYEDLIQTDAAINPGNSGGPLVNINGEVIGINTAIFTRSGGYQGIGFAIPANMVKYIMNSLIESGKITRGWLGVVIQNLNPELAESFDVSITEGVLISNVQDDSPAEKAGIKSGDIVIEYEGESIKNVNQFRNLVAKTGAGNKVKVKVIRDGKEKILTVKIGEQPADLFYSDASGATTEKHLGITVQNLTKELAENMGIEKDSGVLVSDVQPGSTAAMAGVRQGDLIEAVNRTNVKNTAEFKKALKKADKKKGILFLIKRERYSRYLVVKESQE